MYELIDSKIKFLLFFLFRVFAMHKKDIYLFIENHLTTY